MGYNLYIGEFEPVIYEEERYARGGVRLEDVEGPLNSSDRTDNQCWPSYVVWHDFVKEVGLLEVFFGGQSSLGEPRVPYFEDSKGEQHEGLLFSHPGAAPLTREHEYAFVEARTRYKARPENEQEEYVLRRLDWLCWWTNWTLRNCEYPTFANS